MFGIPSLHAEQEEALRYFFSNQDVFVNLPTSFTKKCEHPFRKWYGNLGELRYLVPGDVKMIVATASASKDTRALIYESLKLSNDT